ncbi:MAG TPA: 5-oxoprolinase subunit PxpA [Chitinophagaceae bacterium]
MRKIDLNCDMGEGIGNDGVLMPFITSANIACGFHAGDVNTMYETIELALKHKVSIGAHVSYLDKNNFGRTEMELSEADVFELVQQQLIILNEVADTFVIKLTHVKPHGALYNQSARDKLLAKTIARAVKDFDEQLILFGLSGSASIHEAALLGLKTASEVFADRTYRDDGSLVPRSEPGALIEDTSQVVKQVVQMTTESTVTSFSGKIIPINAETICIHGDGKYAVEFAKAIHDAIK